jgi:hypothetical protein
MLLPRWCIAYLGVPVSLILPHVQSLFPETLEQKALVSEALSMVICSPLGVRVFDTTSSAMLTPRDAGIKSSLNAALSMAICSPLGDDVFGNHLTCDDDLLRCLI